MDKVCLSDRQQQLLWWLGPGQGLRLNAFPQIRALSPALRLHSWGLGGRPWRMRGGGRREEEPTNGSCSLGVRCPSILHSSVAIRNDSDIICLLLSSGMLGSDFSLTDTPKGTVLIQRGLLIIHVVSLYGVYHFWSMINYITSIIRINCKSLKKADGVKMTSWKFPYCVSLIIVPCGRGANLQVNVRLSLKIWAVLLITITWKTQTRQTQTPKAQCDIMLWWNSEKN